MTTKRIPSFDPQIYERDIYQDPNQATIYDSWLKHANERDVLEKVLAQHLSDWCPTNPLSIIELGCGTGSAAKRIFNILANQGIFYQYTGIDPYQDQLQRFSTDIQNNSSIINKNNSITLKQGTAESYIPKQAYDLALVVHSLYYVTDLTTTLTKIHAAANSALIIHHGQAGINTIQERFHHYVKPGPHIISTHRAVTTTLDQLDINYTCHVYPTTVDIRPCKDPTNPSGRNLIKFFLEHAELPDKVIKEVSRYFRTLPDIMQHDMAIIITERKTDAQRVIANHFE